MPLDITVNVSPTGGSVATLSALGYAADRIDVTTDVAAGTIYYLLHNSVTPLSGAAIKSAVVGLTAVGGGTLDPLDVDIQPVDWEAVTPATYWINMVQETSGGFSNVVFLETTVIAASFDPASLPGAEIVVDISDITTLWQANNGTTQVTASGQTVGSVTNRGSLGGLFLNTGGTDEPLYQDVGGRKYLNFDGINDYLRLDQGGGAAFDLSGGFYLWVLAYDDGTNPGSPRRAFLSYTSAGTNSYNQANGLAMFGTDFSTNPFATMVWAGPDNAEGIAYDVLKDTRTTDLPWAVIELQAVPTAASPNVWLRVEKTGDGAPVDVDSHSTSTWPDTTTAAKLMSLGSDQNGGAGALSGFHKCSIAAVVLVTGALSSTDRDDVRAWLRARAAF
jgi:hypothetical protein